MNKSNKSTSKEIEKIFIESAIFTKEHFYNKPYEDRKEGTEAFFHGVLESKFKDLGVDISEVWEILRDTIFHED